ncbi:rod-determining factor RdfA [Halocatena salina]|uniref:Uncharacterized protein n=1 Tax=Halocatena salina TaxID=2934340 RepID=A0A8U0A6A9_9EURY|nr:rod-determining factor RdfA [Halocatena salina]UPM44612.1 hypothetical protein MW046_16310 [Halocatena salina]
MRVDHLEDYWFAESDDRYSLRELAEYANQQLLYRVMQNAGLDPFDSEIGTLTAYSPMTMSVREWYPGPWTIVRPQDTHHRSGDAFGFEFDTGWFEVDGGDLMTFIETHADRTELLHVIDCDAETATSPVITVLKYYHTITTDWTNYWRR